MSELSLADALIGQSLVFFSAYEKSQRGELTLEEVDAQIDQLAIVIQSLDRAGGDPENWFEHLVVRTSSYEHLWSSERIFLFLLGNYAAFHAVLRNETLELPLIAPESIAREILTLGWLPEEITGEAVLATFLQYPASQVPEG